MKNLRKLWVFLFATVLFLWIVVSILRTFYNFSKVFTEERRWIALTDNEKRVKEFGDIYNFFEFIGRNTKTNDSILFFFSDKKFFAGTSYLGIYFLYPRQIYFSQFQKDAISIINSKKINYIVLYWAKNDNSQVQKFFEKNRSRLKTIASYESKTNKGGVYKYE